MIQATQFHIFCTFEPEDKRTERQVSWKFQRMGNAFEAGKKNLTGRITRSNMFIPLIFTWNVHVLYQTFFIRLLSKLIYISGCCPLCLGWYTMHKISLFEPMTLVHHCDTIQISFVFFFFFWWANNLLFMSRLFSLLHKVSNVNGVKVCSEGNKLKFCKIDRFMQYLQT